MINFISSFYLNKERQEELDTALRKNIEQRLIKKIYLFLDDKESYEYLIENFEINKIKIKILGRIPLYSDLFFCANLLPKGEICMISNNDIWLKSIRFKGLLTELEPDMIYALTRHEYDLTAKKQKQNKKGGCHDSFIFKSPVPESIIEDTKHVQNQWGSENIVMFEFWRKKYRLYNPCFHIIIVHEHRSEERPKDRKHLDMRANKKYRIRSGLCGYIDKNINNMKELKQINKCRIAIPLLKGYNFYPEKVARKYYKLDTIKSFLM